MSCGFNEVFLVILVKHFSSERHFLFSQCGCLSGPNYLNLHWKLHFSKNLQDAKFKNILSLRPDHFGPSRDNKTSEFFSHCFSRYNSEKLIRTPHQVNNHGVSRRWFTETDVKHFMSSTLRTITNIIR